MSETNKFYIVNSNSSFKNNFFDSCNQESIECSSVSSKDLLFHSVNGDISLVKNNEIIDVENSKWFIRLRGKFSYSSYLLCEFLKQKGIYFNDSINLRHSNSEDKISQMIRLSLNSVRIPDSIIFSVYSFKKNKRYVLENISYPIVLKGSGSKGKAVWKIENQPSLEEKIREYEDSEMLLLQKVLHNDHDIRVVLFEDNFLGAFKRSSENFLNNVSQGGNVEKIEIPKEKIDIASKAASINEIDFVGVDLMDGANNKTYVLEVNKSPQLFDYLNDFSTPERIFDILKSR